nr:pyridoxamine 5'-phosphate oxidase family protein [uncultured Peptostreptococcus sp.]
MKVIEFLQNARVFQIATVDGDQPHTRPIGFVMEYDGGLAFFSDKRKGMYKQMQTNPKIEICAIDSKLNTLRIVAKAKFITSEDAQRAALEVMPDLAKMGYAVGDDVFEIYTLDNVSFTCKTMIGQDVDGIEL